MKIKIMHKVDYYGLYDLDTETPTLEKRVNDFIADKEVIDIKYSNCISKAANQDMSVTDSDESVLIMYEDKQHVRFDFCSSILNSARNIDCGHGEVMKWIETRKKN